MSDSHTVTKTNFLWGSYEPSWFVYLNNALEKAQYNTLSWWKLIYISTACKSHGQFIPNTNKYVLQTAR